MSYVINKFSGEQLLVLEDGTINTATSINLVGKNYVGYGEAQNENFVWLLENFANDAPPSRPLVGQIWFNTTNNSSYAYDGTTWNPIGSAEVSATAPISPNAGSLWLKTDDNTLQVWLGDRWRFIGPEAVAGFDSTRARSTLLDDISGNPKPVMIFETDGRPFAICTSEAFTIHPDFSISGFSNNLLVGINLSSVAKINGSITGNSGSTDRLLNPRYINNVSFDGQNDITIKSSTTNKLINGTYLVGPDFDGSSEATWAVDATSSNTIGKVVARNSEGGFSAGTILANFVGNLTGNVIAETGTSKFNVIEATSFVGATLTGNANSATQLANPRKINGVSFNGTSDITITAAASTLSGNTLNSNVTESSLQTLGTLRALSVADSGISVGGSSQLRFLVDSGTPTFRSQVGKLNFDMGSTGPDVSFIDSATSLSLGGPNAPAIIGDNTTNLGITGYKFNNIYANNFKGNADTASSATKATNVAGGGAGSIPYQTALDTTGMLSLGTAGYVLKAQASGIGWEALSTESLTKGSYLNMVNTSTSNSVTSYNSNIPVTISVDATSSNTASKVVARDADGNFSAGTITASLTGAASSNVLKSGDTMTGFLTLHAAPTANLHAATKKYVDDSLDAKQYFDEFTSSTKSPTPQSFPVKSIRGFSAYSNTDFPGNYFGGVTVSGPSNVYSGQIAFNWNSEESAPTGLYFRVNDDTSTTTEWSPWKRVATTDDTLTIISGAQYAGGYTNIVGNWSNDSNWFDVFPPSGKTMGSLVAFIPSIHVIHYAGGVNADDSMRCTYSYLADRIRVYVQNTEQRSTPAANYLVVWR